MSYKNHYQHANDVISDLNGYVPTIQDSLLQMKYVGFVTVVAVTCYENAIKEIFCNFAKNTNPVFGTFVARYFHRINGRIKLKDIKNDYLLRFGQDYLDSFNHILDLEITKYLKLNHRDFTAAYGNLIVWRHSFAHEGKINNHNATYSEAVQAFEDGKNVLSCLYSSLK